MLLECAAAASAATVAGPSTTMSVATAAVPAATFALAAATAVLVSEKAAQRSQRWEPAWYEVAWHAFELIYEDVSEMLGMEPWRSQERLAWLAFEAEARREYEAWQEYEALRMQILRVPTPNRGRH